MILWFCLNCTDQFINGLNGSLEIGSAIYLRMKNRKNLFRIACAALFLFTGLPQNSRAQESPKEYWNIRTQLTPLRLPPPPVGYKPEYLDLNGDGKVDMDDCAELTMLEREGE